MSPHTATPLAFPATPLRPVLVFTFLNSVGSAIIYAGIFFLAKHHYGFSKADNFWLALFYGLTYIPGALAIGPTLRRLQPRGIHPRSVLVAMMLVLALACFIPGLASFLNPPGVTGVDLPRWPLWLALGIYSPVSGGLWPLVESYLAGGRSEEQLRSATGKFNICWAGSLVITLLAISWLVESHALLVLSTLGGVHISCLLSLRGFTPAPGKHEHHTHERPVVYHQLLNVLRYLLPAAFLFISALSPFTPAVLDKLSIPTNYHVMIADIWYASRLATFWGMERWHGWHGRWSTPIAGIALLLVSFGAIVLAPAAGTLGLPVLIAGLLGFGVGVGIIYCAALYYAMEVGSDGVDAGGTHETLIGMGYTAGPVCGLVAHFLVTRGVFNASEYEMLMIALVAAIALTVSTIAIVRARSHARG